MLAIVLLCNFEIGEEQRAPFPRLPSTWYVSFGTLAFLLSTESNPPAFFQR